MSIFIVAMHINLNVGIEAVLSDSKRRKKLQNTQIWNIGIFFSSAPSKTANLVLLVLGF